MVDKTIPYNDLPILPPAYIFDDIEILKKSNKANKAVAELKSLIRTIEDPNKPNLMLSPLKVKEAVESSGIEDIHTTMVEALQAELFSIEKLSQEQKEIKNYKESLLEGFEIIKNQGFLKTNDLIAIQSFLDVSHKGIRNLSGTKIGNRKTGEVFYTPPEGEDLIRALLKNFEEYYNNSEEEPDYLVKMAILHYQFEAIHPFFDGNGRTGRILMVLYLVLHKVLLSPTLFISQYINSNRSEYYRLLRGVTYENNWKDWVLFILDAAETQALKTNHTITEILRIKENLRRKIFPKHTFSYPQEFLDYLFSNAFYTQAKLIKNTPVRTRNTASDYMNALVNEGILKVSETKSREKIYYFPELLRILE